jgi:hypothetical protein
VAGVGIDVSSPDGDVTVSNTGVTTLVAGTGITISGATGAVTVNATPGIVALSSSSILSASIDATAPTPVTTDVVYMNLSQNATFPYLFTGFVSNPAFTNLDSYIITVRSTPAPSTPGGEAFGATCGFSSVQTVPGSVRLEISLGFNTDIRNSFSSVILTRIRRAV